VIQPARDAEGYAAPRTSDRSDLFGAGDPLLDQPQWMEVMGS
jgi:hypothetical protein